jgi:hypothetical protein
MQPEDYMSFLVRLWRDHLGTDQLSAWHGEIELIQTGTRCSFCTLGELLAFMQQLTAAPPGRTLPTSEISVED